MRFWNRPAGPALALVAMLALGIGCQTRDGSLPTEADRSIATAASADEIEDWIIRLLPPDQEQAALAHLAKAEREFSKGNVAKGQKFANDLIDFLRKHQPQHWSDVDPTGSRTELLILTIQQWAMLIDIDLVAVGCTPGVDCEAMPPSGEGEVDILGNLIPEDLTLVMFEVDCPFGPNSVGPCYEIQTDPPGFDFGSSASSSLSLSNMDGADVAVCSEFGESFDVGSEVFLWHEHEGEIAPVKPAIEVVICDTGPIAELNSRWANPLLATFSPVLEILSPQPLYAAVAGSGLNIGGTISNFSTVGSCLPGCIPTTTTLSIVGSTTTFTEGETITFLVEVEPAPFDDESSFAPPNPQGPMVLLLPTDPLFDDPPARILDDGQVTVELECGSEDIPAIGQHAAAVVFFGTPSHAESGSGDVSYQCNPVEE